MPSSAGLPRDRQLLDPGTLFVVGKKDRRVKPGDGEREGGDMLSDYTNRTA